MNKVIVDGLDNRPDEPIESDMPRYVQYATYADGTSYYRYNPPQNFVDAGVVKRVVLSPDRLTAFQEADEYNNAIDEYRHQQSMEQDDKAHDPTVQGLCDLYMRSSFYEKLRPVSKDQYSYFIQKLCHIRLDNGKLFGEVHYRDVTNGSANRVYDKLVQLHRERGGDGIQMANHVLSVAKRVWSVANKWEVIHRNPWRHVDKMTPKSRKVKWTEDQVKQLLNVAFSRYEWRSVGIIFALGYATAQRPGDLRMATWDNIRFDQKTFVTEQSKTSADVAVPLDDSVVELLDQQYQEFGQQQYVAPHPRTLRPYELTHLSKTFARIREAAGLSNDLQLRDMRRTVISELADASATEAEIMAWSGHKNPQSLKPYLRVGKAAAKSAFEKRRGTVD